MQKKEILQQLYAAKKSHLKWVQNAKHLISGLILDQEKVPLQPTHCKFGQWYYGEGQEINDLEEFRVIETIHIELHTMYEEIFNILFSNTQNISSLIGTVGYIAETEVEVVEKKFLQLQDISSFLINQIDNLANLINKKF